MLSTLFIKYRTNFTYNLSNTSSLVFLAFEATSIFFLLSKTNMGVISASSEYATPIAPARMFKALIIDAHNLVPKLSPQAVKSVDVVEGVPGEAGCIKQTNFADGLPFKYLKHKIDAIDSDNLVCKYSLIEGDAMADKIDLVVYTIKFEASSGGGCVIKVTTEGHVKAGQEVDEATIKAGQEQEIGYYKLVETHLLANPEVYA
ncbi:hypothetical protein ACOSQ4_007379 [Xanthoceras sorbifolium]